MAIYMAIVSFQSIAAAADWIDSNRRPRLQEVHMDSLMVATFIHEAGRPKRGREDAFLEGAALAYVAARRALLSVTTGIASLVALIVAFDVLR
jgi:hypothetical protein